MMTAFTMATLVIAVLACAFSAQGAERVPEVVLNFTWTRDTARAAVAENTAIRNRTGRPIENVEITCALSKLDGTLLGKLSRPIAGIIGVEASKNVGNIATGFVIEDGMRAACAVSNFTFLSQEAGPSTVRPTLAPEIRTAQPQQRRPAPPTDDEKIGPKEAACAAEARSRVPFGADVHSVDSHYSRSTPGRFERQAVVVDYDFYRVIFDVSFEGRRFAYEYLCRIGRAGDLRILGRQP